ncbi:hypothetical protein QE152_g6308 [Popillia japonica]|uniref:Uncharacterized protein n=1 Tax=Popillia japonica TaxID=7064 RepID=A0AAW1MHX0_POPJA
MNESSLVPASKYHKAKAVCYKELYTQLTSFYIIRRFSSSFAANFTRLWSDIKSVIKSLIRRFSSSFAANFTRLWSDIKSVIKILILNVNVNTQGHGRFG